MSEFTIVNAAMGSGQFLVGGLFLLLLGIVFIGMGATVLPVVQGSPPEQKAQTSFQDGFCTSAPILLSMGACAAPGPLHSAVLWNRSCVRPLRSWRCSDESDTALPVLRTGQAIPRGQIPRVPFEEFRVTIVDAVAGGQRVVALFGDAPAPTEKVDLYAVLADSSRALLCVGKATLDSDRFPSLTPECPQVHLFEREIAEQYGVCPEGHPWFKPVRFHPSYRPGQDAWGRKPGEAPIIGVTDFYRVEGEEIHEVAVGPVHAGVIEPGHFRFQCHGEQVFHLEISLGYQHRGIERALIGGPTKRTAFIDGGSRGGHLGRPCHRLLPSRGDPRGMLAYRFGPRYCAVSPWSWSGWPITRAT